MRDKLYISMLDKCGDFAKKRDKKFKDKV